MANKNFSNTNQGGIALIKGPYRQLVDQSVQLLNNAKEGVFVIDAGDVFNELNVGKVEGFAPITAFQLRNYVEEDFRNQINGRMVVISGMKSLFFDQNLLDGECSCLLKEVMSKLKSVAESENVPVIVLEFNEQYDNDRNDDLSEVLESGSDLSLNLGAEAVVCKI